MSEEKSTCQICNKIFRSVGEHVGFAHKITAKEYYDKFYRKEDEGKCQHPSCDNDTIFINFRKGYRKHCSMICNNTNPAILKLKIESRLETEINNPEIQIKRTQRYKQTLLNDPSINIRRGENISKTLKENPEIIEDRKILYKQWCAENPEKSIKRSRNGFDTIIRNQTCIPFQYIAKYNYDNVDSSSLPYFIYLVKHSTKPIIKIGITYNTNIRLKGLIKDFGKCEIFYALKGPYNKIHPLESYLHDYFKDFRKIQPSGGGKTEWFDKCILEEAINMIVLE